MGPILILGATSTIADAIAREFASHDSNLVLVARNVDELESRASDLRLRYGVTVRTLQFDALAFETHPAVIESCMNGSDDPPEGAILCFGYLGDQRLAQEDFSEGRTIFDTNFTAAVSLIEVLASRFEERKSGFICALSSGSGGSRPAEQLYLRSLEGGALTVSTGTAQSTGEVKRPSNHDQTWHCRHQDDIWAQGQLANVIAREGGKGHLRRHQETKGRCLCPLVLEAPNVRDSKHTRTNIQTPQPVMAIMNSQEPPIAFA